MTDLKPKDLIAIITLLCVIFLIYTGYQGTLTETLTLGIGYYFGLRKPQQEDGR